MEGFKDAPGPKIGVWRAVNGEPLLCTNDAHIVAVASDASLPQEVGAIQMFDLNDAPGIAQFVCADDRFSFPLGES